MRHEDYEVREGDLYMFYGILMYGTDLGEIGEYVQDCEVRGEMYSVGSFPAVILGGDGTVRGRLWRAPDDEFERTIVAEQLDHVEGFSPGNPSSMYIRKKVQLQEPDVEAWIYEWNGSTDSYPRVPSGDWNVHWISG